MQRIQTGLLASVALMCCASLAQAQSVTLAGMMGGKALVIVDGKPPKAVGAGESHQGIKIVSTDGESAVVEVAGRRHTLRVGDAPASVGGGGGAAGGDKIVLAAGSGGHFFKQGQINGKSVELMVDTGATSIGIGVEDAKRLGLNYQAGQQVRVSTANGMTTGWRIKLSSVRVGDVEVFDVDAVVSTGSMPYVLLGNSFLNRFQMTRNNDQMVLLKR
jgi:aspartyl protease family protein